MSPAAPIEPRLPETSTAGPSPAVEGSLIFNGRFSDLRGVQWRIQFGILPPSSSSSIDDLRRVTANSRRRYAGSRRHLLVDPHVTRDGVTSPNLVMDNPLSQNPDSMWGRFFRNAELERMVDQDLSRLYPEHGSYFQSPELQSMFRRILLLWCLMHPEYGYKQGMHELLAPLLYVLHADIAHLSEVRKLYGDHFIDIDGFAFNESDLTFNFDFRKFSESTEDETGSQKCGLKINSLDELDPKIQDIVLLSDAYGAEGELGVVLSEKFMEHDAYCMFDAVMSGTSGAVRMVDFFSPSPLGGSQAGLPPVIEASSALYHLLSVVDASLHSHLVELGVEPQFFALRWLRVLFGREFSLEYLLIIWDEIFAFDNSKSNKFKEDVGSSSRVLSSHRGAFISAFAVSMILYLRPSLLAAENATSCLQRLLNFPANINLKKLIAKARSLQPLALDANSSIRLPMHTGSLSRSKSAVVRGHSLSSDSISPRTPLSFVPESYWEEKWRDLHKAEQLQQSSSEKSDCKKGWSEKVRLTLSGTGSAPSSSKEGSGKIDSKLSVRRSLLEDLSQQLGPGELVDKMRSSGNFGQTDAILDSEVNRQGGINNNFCCTPEDQCLSGIAASAENSCSNAPSLNDPENQSRRSSVASNLPIDENDDEPNSGKSCRIEPKDSPLPVSDSPGTVSLKDGLEEDSRGKMTIARSSSAEEISLRPGQDNDVIGKSVTPMKERKLFSGKFQWLWRLGRNNGEGTSGRLLPEATKSSNVGTDQNNTTTCSMVNGSNNSSMNGKGDAVDRNMATTLRNLGHSMLENIQVIESVFHQEQSQVGFPENSSKHFLGGEGQVTPVAAIRELRKIGNLLREM
ncbi:uncharacterized protein LOC127794485 [Diospyros lotus]|uniref:uncharacterized protein LOC127794485 n=1 Tax=Diospyros lotus TaxID=55363 RepID=UPI002254D8DC|nr:uncharacterized protein LOC127794485 [Diospyros lotus]